MSENDSDTGDDSEFQDAKADFSMPDVGKDAQVDTSDAIQDVYKAIDLCLNNKFFEAEGLVKPWAKESMFHSLAYATIHVLQSVMTVIHEDILATMEYLRTAKTVASKHRKQQGTLQAVSSWLVGRNLTAFTAEELQAELIHTECMLMKGLLTFLQDENFISFIKGGLKIRSCYRSYRECYEFLQQHPEQCDREFVAGVKYGFGTFNLIISLLPARVIHLLEFMGFAGNKEVGLKLLDEVYRTSSIHTSMSALLLLLYHTIIPYIFGLGDGDVNAAEELVAAMLQKYPNGAFFLYFKGRTEVIQAHIDPAIEWFEKSLASQQQWPHLHHLCYWELMWGHCLQLRWAEAASFAGRLVKENRWSKASYMYFEASNLLMLGDEAGKNVAKMMKEIPSHKQRIAGRSVPFEKFAVHKCERFQKHGKLFLPALEVIYVWNGFNILCHSSEQLQKVMVLVNSASKALTGNAVDDRCLARLIRGVCLRHLKRLDEAETELRQILLHSEELAETYLVPYSLVELGLCLMEAGRKDEARQCLIDARSNYQKYALQSRLHFRIHAALTELT